jgi:hypothetical protein
VNSININEEEEEGERVDSVNTDFITGILK